MTKTNEFGQPVGDKLDGWRQPRHHAHQTLAGQYVTLEPLTIERHAEAIVAAFDESPDSLWTYLHWPPVHSTETIEAIITWLDDQPDWLSWAVVANGTVTGFLSYLRIDPPNGVTEIGGIVFSPQMQRTRLSTEAVYLLMKKAFADGYRRVEWKCDDLNAPSRAAALRFGMKYEGTFRQATHYWGRNRDTAWYSMVDTEWQTAHTTFETWLSPHNFDAEGNQHRSLGDIRSQIGDQS